MPKSYSEKVEEFFQKQTQWKEILGTFRDIALSLDVEETYKWMFPTYTVNGKNVFSFGSFKHHVAIWFFYGNAMEDAYQLLTNAQEGKTHHMRQWRIEKPTEINLDVVRHYMEEAIRVVHSGLIEVSLSPKIKTEKQKVRSSELLEFLDSDSKLHSQFLALTPAQQSNYHQYIDEAKRKETKLKRIQKIKEPISLGKDISYLWTKK